MGKLNPWLQEKLKGVDPERFRVIVEVDPKRFGEAVMALRRMGLSIVSTSFDRFITVVVPDAATLEQIGRLPFVVEIHYDMPKYIKPLPPLPTLVDLPAKALERADPLLGVVRVSEVEVPGLKPPSPIAPFGGPGLPRLKRQDVEIIPSFRTAMMVKGATKLSGKGVKIAVIDTGATPFHPQFNGKMVRLASVVPEPPFDFQGHGQWTTTMAAGKTAKTRFGYVTGVAPDATILHVKALTTAGFGSSSGIIKAMEIALKWGAKVVSMSLGGEQQGPVDHDPEVKATKILYDHGVLVVVAAGNEGPDKWTIASPGVSPWVLTVGAWSTMYRGVAVYSSRGPQGSWYRDHRADWQEDYDKYGYLLLKPDVVAPGGGPAREGQKPIDLIYSGCTGWFDGFYDLLADGYEAMRGTSMATPHVSGLMALLAEATSNRITMKTVKAILERASPVKDEERGHGFVTLDWFKYWIGMAPMIPRR